MNPPFGERAASVCHSITSWAFMPRSSLAGAENLTLEEPWNSYLGKTLWICCWSQQRKTLYCNLSWRGCSNYSSLRLQSSLVCLCRGGKEWKILSMLIPEDCVGSKCMQDTDGHTISEDFLQSGFCLWTHLRVKVRNFLRNSVYFMHSLSALSKPLISAYLAWMPQKDKYLHEISSDFYFQKSQK